MQGVESDEHTERLHNIREVIAAGACAVGMDGHLVNKQWIEAGNYAAMTKLASECVSLVKE
ncbi:hypothetical protein [Paenibacillus sp. FSL H8-0034]|uniref:hypothetical protein n=1 Tax=Paenibacillus sp. FSL H8-0034 TaxID=2954671 RepID=UPI0030F7B602